MASQSERRIRAAQVPSGEVEEVVFAAGVRTTQHAHRQSQILIVLDGAYTNIEDGIVTSVKPGTIHARPPGLPHATTVDALRDLRLLRIKFRSDPWATRREGVVGAPSGFLLTLAAELRRELLVADDLSASCLEAVLGLVAAHVERALIAGDVEPAWMRAAVAMVERGYADRLSLQRIADGVGVHRTTVAAAFRRYRRTSVGELIRDTRLRAAAVALTTTNRPIDEIALTCGFYDQSHLTRLFRRAIGCTPGEYRRNGRLVWPGAAGAGD